jgi:hypothetical protein
MTNFTCHEDESFGELQAGREIEASNKLLIQARKSMRDPQVRRLLDELEIDLRDLSDQQFVGWPDILVEELADK